MLKWDTEKPEHGTLRKPENRDPGTFGALEKPGPRTLVGPYKNQNTGPGPGFPVFEGSQ